MPTQLYYINHADILGDEQDLLVEATSVEEALYLWMEHYDIDPDDLGKSPEEDFYPSVFAVPALTGTPHPLQWHVEIKIVN
jgi:hypothetical protein